MSAQLPMFPDRTGRNRRPCASRPKTERREWLSRIVREDGGVDDGNLPRLPATRGDCINMPRPCPFVSCRFHLYLDETIDGIKFNWPDVEPEDMDRMSDTCALDVADRGPATEETVAELLNMTRVGLQRVEHIAMERLRRNARRQQRLRELRDNTDE